MEVSKLESIALPNRDGASLYLTQIEEGSDIYQLMCDEKHKYILDFACITLCEDNTTIQAYDPSGGPYLYVGYTLPENRTIKAIIPWEDGVVFLIKKE